ncbi:4-hydroxyphenylacetate decarboxylase large subunit [bioreactor metagenome]|uniref:4-hydroxyphenylacetate decarboxylase large subunit n=1 Tax=bioreactor metagenome TaxID=1076179 RepID=A0A645FE08_9ZZZZ
MELSDTVFRNDEDLDKVATLVTAFIRLGCQQLQMNVLNPEILAKAQQNPEQYRNLIVRVWGWSGYFVELAPAYQQHIMNRNHYILG